MRSPTMPLAHHLAWLVAVSALPACWFVMALTMSAYDPEWPSAVALTMGGLALLGGLYGAVLIARGVGRAVDDLAIEAGMLRQALPLARLHTNVTEFAAIADGLQAAAARMRALNPPVEIRSAEIPDKPLFPAMKPSMAMAPACEAAALVEAVALSVAFRMEVAGIALLPSSAPSLGPVQGKAEDLAAALEILMEGAIRSTPRGGKIALEAEPFARGHVRVAISAEGPELEMHGMALAGRMIELNCGTIAAAAVARSRALVERNGGVLLLSGKNGNAMTMILPLLAEARAKAA